MKITRFEDIKAWQRARDVARLVAEMCTAALKPLDPKLRQQLSDASDSVMANIAEGHKSGSDREFIRFLRIAMRSAAEVQSHLYVGLDRKHFQKSDFDRAYKACEDTKGLIGGFIRYLSRPRTSPRRRRTDPR